MMFVIAIGYVCSIGKDEEGRFRLKNTLRQLQFYVVGARSL